MSNDRRSPDFFRAPAIVAATVVAIVLAVLIGWQIRKNTRPVRASSSDKAVPNNLRMLWSGADYYFRIHPSATAIPFAELVGTNSSQYVKTFATVAGETYPLVIVKGSAVTASGVAGARTITYAP